MVDRSDSEAPGPLPEGYVLNGFVIGKVIGVGGFSIVYEAWDPKVEREIAIKEYMPTSLATRSATQHVTLLSRANQDTFEIGLRSFVNEARLLGQLEHECLVKVYQFWEENGTAYMVMPRYRARTLKAVRSQMTKTPNEAWLRGVLDPVLSVLKRLHSQGVFHRDIAPDNIMLRDDGRPIVLDFGAARKVITGRSQMLTAILKPHYAPVEQYAETPGLRQGPWTDIYAVGATMRYLITGDPPMPATARIMGDDDPPLASLNFPGISQRLLQTIDAMLIPQPQKRPASVQAVRDLLAGKEPVPPADGSDQTTVMRPPPADDRTVIPGRAGQPQAPTPSRPADLLNTTRETSRAATNGAASGVSANPSAHAKPASSQEPTAGRAGRGIFIAAGLAAVLLLSAGAWWLGVRSSGADRTEPPVAQAQPPAVATPGPTPEAKATLPAPAPVTPIPANPSAPVVAATAGVPVPAPVGPAPVAGPATETPGKAASSPATVTVTKPPQKAIAKDESIPAKRDSVQGQRPTVAQAPPAPAPRNQAPESGSSSTTATKPGAPADVAKGGPAAPTSTDASSTQRSPAGPLPPAQDPHSGCGNRFFIALDNCLRRQCALPEFARHAECARVRGICELPNHAANEDCKQLRSSWSRLQGRS